MRKKKIVIGGKELEIEVYETEIPLNGRMTVEEYRKKKDKEKAFDSELDKLADMIAARLSPRMNTGTRTLVYWEMGKLIGEFIRRASSEEETRREPYEVQEKAYERLKGKISERLKNVPGIEKMDYSVPYLKKWERLSRRFTREQAERPVPYPLAHELLYDELDEKEIEAFLDQCEKGEFDNISLRAAVAELRKGKKPAVLIGLKAL